MYQIKLTPEFSAWFDALRDGMTRKRLGMRLRKAQLGQLGDIKPIAQGVWEMREFFGPGWRMYYMLQDTTLVVMLGGGDKSSQRNDIAKAISLAQQLSSKASS